MSDFSAIGEALVACDMDKVMGLVKMEMDQGTSAGEILNKGLIAGMDVVGERMENEEMFIPEVLMAAQIMTTALNILKPHLSDADAAKRGKVVIGTVQGDLHDIGKNLVAMMLESVGLEVHNLGTDVSPEQFVNEIKAFQPNIIGMSALLTTTMPSMKATIDSITEAGLRDQVKILIGGAPVTQSYADQIGADGFAPDAGAAAKLAKTLV